MKRQTAVEWLVEQMIYQMDIRIENTTIGCELFEQAKTMEKEQIQDAFYYGVDVDSWNVESPYREAEEYYKKTFDK